MILAVTGFIPIPGHPRSVGEYFRLGEKLLNSDIPVLTMRGGLESCWLYQHLAERGGSTTWSTDNNPRKNTLAYHCVQAQKTEWLAEIVDYLPKWAPLPDVLVWIDFGIYNIPGITPQILQDFMHRAEDEQAICIPGCWSKKQNHDDRYPNWRFCGGTLIMPRIYAEAFDAAVKDEYIRRIEETGHVTWEVNCWASVEQRHPELPIWAYRADHDSSMFTKYLATEKADGHQAEGLRGFC